MIRPEEAFTVLVVMNALRLLDCHGPAVAQFDDPINQRARGLPI